MKKAFTIISLFLATNSLSIANPFAEEWIGGFLRWDTDQHVCIQSEDAKVYFRTAFAGGDKKYPVNAEVLKEIEHPDYTINFYAPVGHSFILPGFKIARGFFINQINRISASADPELVLPGLVSTEKTEYAFAVTPDNQTAYFVRRNSFFKPSKSTIYVTHLKDDQWSTPVVAPFSGKFSDGDPFITPDGKRLFFTSDRPVKEREEKTDKDIWYLQRTTSGWTKPIHLAGVNSTGREYSPSLTEKGDLFFGSTREGGYGWGDIYFSEWKDGRFQTPQNMGANINTNDGEWGSCISPDGTFIIFEASGRPENYSPSGDLFISYLKNGEWSKAKNLLNLNSTGSDLTPKLSADGKYLYFGSNRHPDIRKEMKNDNVEVYRIQQKEIDP